MIEQFQRYAGVLVVAAGLCGAAQAQSTENAAEVRGQLHQQLSQYPPSLAEVLKLDNSLLQNKEFLAPYPGLSTFISAHPEILRNPSYFVGESREYFQQPENRSESAQLASEVMTPMAVSFVLGCMTAALAWIVKSVIDYRRWLRMSRTQTEVHSKLLERFTASADLLAYIESPAGKSFLESGPIAAESSPRLRAPLARILFSVQVGVVLGFAGLGILYAGRVVSSEFFQPFFILGILGVALSIGFVLSALASYMISRSLGMIVRPENREPTAPPI
jgi:hypothetical protein